MGRDLVEVLAEGPRESVIVAGSTYHGPVAAAHLGEPLTEDELRESGFIELDELDHLVEQRDTGGDEPEDELDDELDDEPARSPRPPAVPRPYPHPMHAPPAAPAQPFGAASIAGGTGAEVHHSQPTVTPPAQHHVIGSVQNPSSSGGIAQVSAAAAGGINQGRRNTTPSVSAPAPRPDAATAVQNPGPTAPPGRNPYRVPREADPRQPAERVTAQPHQPGIVPPAAPTVNTGPRNTKITVSAPAPRTDGAPAPTVSAPVARPDEFGDDIEG